MEKLKVFTAFSGYDSQCMALDRAGVEYELVGWSEIDKYAIDAHNAVYPHWKDRNLGDICKIDWNGLGVDIDLFTYSFPCTDISSAGRQGGLEEGSGTRSSLLWECRKAIETKHPKYLLMENVKQLVSKRFFPFFEKWINFLESEGYSNYWKVLNAKDYGVPQNRERIFCVSVLGGRDFQFPQAVPLARRVSDILENSVPDKYYIQKNIDIRLPKRVDLPNIIYKIGNYHNSGHNASTVIHYRGISPTVMENHGTVTAVLEPLSHKVRKLTEREYFRLQDVSDEDIDRIFKAVTSRSQQRKLAGNSIAVACMEHIFKELFTRRR